MLGLSDEVIEAQVKGITLEEIAWRLSQLVRFGGEPRRPFTVLQHSLCAHSLIKQFDQSVHGALLDGLLHDMSEVFINDIRRPFKAQEQRDLECRVHRIMWRELGLSDHTTPMDFVDLDVANAVEEADFAINLAEGHVLAVADPWFADHAPDEDAVAIVKLWQATPLPVAREHFVLLAEALLGNNQKSPVENQK